MGAMAKRRFDMGVKVVGLGAMQSHEWHMQMALTQMRRKAFG